MKKIFKSYLFNFILIGGFAITAIFFSVKDDFSGILEALSHAHWWIVVIGLIMMFSYHFIEGIILSLYARLYQTQYTIKKGFKNASVGAFFANISPFQAASQFVQTYTFTRQGIKTGEAASILMMNFIVYQLTLVAFVAFLVFSRFAFYYAQFQTMYTLVFIGFAVNVTVILVLIITSTSTKIHDLISDYILPLLKKIRLVKDLPALQDKFNEHLYNFKKELLFLTKQKKLIFIVVSLNLFKLSMFYSTPFLCYLALGYPMDISYLHGVMMISAFIYTINAVTPIPGDAGISEATYVIGFTLLFNDILPNAALAASATMILWRFMNYFFVTILTGLIFAFSGKDTPPDAFEKKHMKTQLKHDE